MTTESTPTRIGAAAASVIATVSTLKASAAAPTATTPAVEAPAAPAMPAPTLAPAPQLPVPASARDHSPAPVRGGPAPAVSLAVLQPREPGIYFGLPEAEYHADPSLGSTDLKRLKRSTMDYWWASWMNPKREPDAGDTPAKRQGRALHKLVLEGRAAFHKAYIPEVQPEQWPDALRTMDDLKAVLRQKGEKLSGSKEELTKRVRAVAPEAIIWDEVVAQFKATVERDGLQILKPDVFAEVEEAGHMIAMNPHLANAFKNGVPEVSVFWRDPDLGIPLKARYDYLKPLTIPDLKKCENKGEHPFPTACKLALRSYRYDMQVVQYLEDGYPAFLEHARAGRIFGDCPLPDGFWERMAAPEDMTFTFVFHQTSGAPVTYGMEIPSLIEDAVGNRIPNPVLAKARTEVAAMKRLWLECMERFGTDTEWVSQEPIHRLTVEEMPYEWRVAAELAIELEAA